MYKIDIKNLEIMDKIGFGGFSINKKCIYENKEYSLKIFDEPNKVFDKDLEEKYFALMNLSLKYSNIPKYIVTKDNINIGYISELLDDYLISKKKSLVKRVEMLKNVKNAILELHENNIIHTDIHSGNIMYSSKDDTCKLIDFDNSCFGKYKSKKSLLDENASEFVNKFGFCNELDIYMFNLLTYSEIVDYDYRLAKRLIENKHYYVFDSEKMKNICDSLLLNHDRYIDEFLVDLIDIEKIKEIDNKTLY